MSKILANLSMRQRITILVVAIAVGVGLYSLVQWKKEADFRPLFTGLTPEDAAGIVQKLKESGADYRLPEGGGSVLVPSARLAELRLTMASIGLPKSGRIGFELFDKVNLGCHRIHRKGELPPRPRRRTGADHHGTGRSRGGSRPPDLPEGFRLSRSPAARQSQRSGQDEAGLPPRPAERSRHQPSGGQRGRRPFSRTRFPCWT